MSDEAGDTQKNSIGNIFNNHNESGKNVYDIKQHLGMI